MLEIRKMQRYTCGSQTKHPNYLNSAPVQMSWNKRSKTKMLLFQSTQQRLHHSYDGLRL